MTRQCLISDEEKWDRYRRMRREAASELTSYIHAISTDDDFIDRMELVVLWRMSCEGTIMTQQTWEQMIEATNE